MSKAYAMNDDGIIRPFEALTEDELKSRELAFNVMDYGADRSGLTDSTAAVQAAVNAAIAAGSGTIVFPNKAGWSRYRIDGTVTVAGIYSKVIRFECEDSLLLASENVGAPVFKVWSPYSYGAAAAPPYLRRLSFRDLRLQAHENWGAGVQRRRRAFDIRVVQDLELDNVWMSGFRQGGVSLADTWDYVFNNVQMLSCGWGDPSDAVDPDLYYALSLSTIWDNTNAGHFQGLHIEQSPLMLEILGRSRHNHFVNSKFEQGDSPLGLNKSGRSPIHVEGTENSFANIHFTLNQDPPAGASGPAFMSVPAEETAGTADWQTSTKRFVTVMGSSFSTPYTKGTKWFAGSRAKFLDVVFQRALGDATAAAFTLGSDVSMTDCEVTHVPGHSGTFRLEGSGNRVRNMRAFYADAGNAGAVVTVGADATDNSVEDVKITGTPASLLSSAVGGSSLGSNRIKLSGGRVTSSPNSGAPTAFDSSTFLNLEGSSAGTVTGFNHGYNGQRLVVRNGASAATTVQSNTKIKTKAGSDLTLVPGAVTEFICNNGVWYEV